MEISGYRLGRKIAETELCSVHNAIDLATSKTVSVRIFHERLTRHPGFCAGFSRFADSIRGKQTGSMVALLQYDAAETGCYAVTDYFPCLPLLQTQPASIPVKAILQGGLEIAATLQLLHGQDLVHGALRPGNLFFNDRLELTLGLGINRPEGKSARPLPIDSVSAALYQPPEGGNGPDADWYALGICLYLQLTGRPPFDDRNLQNQLKQKRQGIALLPDDSHRALLPLLQGLLHPDPGRRILDCDAFWERADAGGYRLLRPRFAAAATPPEKPVSVPEASAPEARPASATGKAATTARQRQPFLRQPWLAAAGAALLLGIALTLFWPAAPVPGQAPAPVSAQSPPAGTLVSPDSPPVQAEADAGLQTAPPPPDRLPQDEQRFLQARSLFADGQPGKALMSVNEALRINPQHRDAAQLRQSILDELQIRSVLKQAEQQLQAGRLSSPPGDNALESYRSLTSLLPKGDPRMQRGLSRIANRFVELSRKAVAQQRLDEALQLAETGAELFPSFSPLQALKEDIARQIDDRKLAAQRRRQEARKLEQIRRIEQARQQKRQQLNARRRELSDRFDRALAAGTPLSTGIVEATKAYEALKQLEADDAQLNSMQQRLVDARIRLSDRQLAAGQYDAANRTLQQGLALGDNSGALQRQIARLQQAIEQRQQQQHADTLLDEAQLLTESAGASPVELGRAAQVITQVMTFAPEHPRIPALRQQLLQAYDRLAAQAIESGQLDEAERYITQGLSMGENDPGLQARRQQLDEARNREKRRSVPVIGTF